MVGAELLLTTTSLSSGMHGHCIPDTSLSSWLSGVAGVELGQLKFDLKVSCSLLPGEPESSGSVRSNMLTTGGTGGERGRGIKREGGRT